VPTAAAAAALAAVAAAAGAAAAVVRCLFQVERERGGITIKAQSASLVHQHTDGQLLLLPLLWLLLLLLLLVVRCGCVSQVERRQNATNKAQSGVDCCCFCVSFAILDVSGRSPTEGHSSLLLLLLLLRLPPRLLFVCAG
jgi:hypothetical protein